MNTVRWRDEWKDICYLPLRANICLGIPSDAFGNVEGFRLGVRLLAEASSYFPNVQGGGITGLAAYSAKGALVDYEIFISLAGPELRCHTDRFAFGCDRSFVSDCQLCVPSEFNAGPTCVTILTRLRDVPEAFVLPSDEF
jgi:hypothetical protein